MTEEPYAKPLPNADDMVTATYWEAARNHQLVVSQCEDCQHVFFYPRRFCPQCWSERISTIEASGRGTVFSFTWVHVPFYDDSWKNDVPYCIGWIELEEGVRMVSAVVDLRIGDIGVGDAVTVCFDDVTSEITLPKFRRS